MNMYIPLLYTVKSRLPSRLEQLSWVLNFIAPTFAMGLYFCGLTVWQYALVYVLALFGFFAIYELGYMANDTFVVKRETSPTLRLGDCDAYEVESRFGAIVIVRVMLAAAAAIALGLLQREAGWPVHWLPWALLLPLVGLAYYGHNAVRSRLNILTYFLLSSMKYAMILPLVGAIDPVSPAWLLAVTLFPLWRSIEFAAKPRFGLTTLGRLYKSPDAWRMAYYALLTLLAALTAFVEGRFGVRALAAALFGYFLLYRVGIYVLLTQAPRLRKKYR